MTSQEIKLQAATEDLIEALKIDAWPLAATCIDFKIRTAKHLNALRFAYTRDEVSAERFDAALGNAQEIQKLISEHNPCREAIFETQGDDLTRTMDHEHPRWPEFIERLWADLACNEDIWVCPGDLSVVRNLLKDMEMDVANSLEAFMRRGDDCDCLVLFRPVEKEGEIANRGVGDC